MISNFFHQRIQSPSLQKRDKTAIFLFCFELRPYIKKKEEKALQYP